MRFLLIGILSLLTVLPAGAQLNVSLLGQLGYSEDLSDIWGWRNPVDNKEYALVGVFDGFSIVDVSNPASPVEVQFVPGAPTIWRDIKTWDHYAYVTNENTGGLLIVDLAGLPGSISTVSWNGGVGYESAHNIFMDENGVAYLCGSNGSLGTLFLDCASNPTNPPILGSYTLRYVHDLYVRGDTMWTAEINDGIFSVLDISDKSSPSVMATQGTTSDFSHNCWLSDDGAYLFTTDEVSDANIDAYDVSDLSDIQRLDTWQSNPGSGVIPHNTFVHGDYLVTAYYRDGVTITDATYPDNMVETGFYDTSPFSGDGFNGAWGAYPYLPSGNLIVSDIENGLYVLGPTYTQAAYLLGNVTDSVSGAAINGATITVEASADAAEAETDLFGDYATGTAYPGTYTISASAFGYNTKSVSGVSLSSGVQSIVDFALAPLPTFDLIGTVIDSVTGQGIPFASLEFTFDGTPVEIIADASGNFSQPDLLVGSYEILAGAWGWQTKLLSSVALGSGSLTVPLNQGWYDDFVFDLGWSASATASTGFWVREVPIATFSGGLVNPDEDYAFDFGEKAYITGNGGGGGGTDDVDDGVVWLSSPSFDVSYMGDPRIQYRQYYFNAGGAGPANDTLFFRVSDGTNTETVSTRFPGVSTAGTWLGVDVAIPAGIDTDLPLTFQAQAADRASDGGHLVEAGLDRWTVVDEAVTGPPSAAWAAEPFCAGEPITFSDLSTGFPGTWSWTFADGVPSSSSVRNPSVIFPGAGTYPVTLTVYNGVATSTQTANITVGEAIALTLGSTASTTGSDGTAFVDALSGGVMPFTYAWDDPAGSTTASISGLSAGTYTCTVTDANGCQQSANVQVTGVVGLGTADAGTWNVFPNPFAQQTTVNMPIPGKVQWSAFDAAGRMVGSGQWTAGNNQLGANWADGTYTIQWQAESGALGSFSLIKQQP